jgi:transposase, IS5 family
VDRGYQGHEVSGDTAVFVAGRRCKITPAIRRELCRRSAIEAMTGHMKLDGKLARNHLKASLGDAIHALLCGAGHNLRLILRHLARLLRALFQLLAALHHERDAALKPA